jgi:outer membrane protein assembly factor BamA
VSYNLSEKKRKIRKKNQLNNEKIWKIQKKIVKRYGKYGRKASRIVIRYKKIMEEKKVE